MKKFFFNYLILFPILVLSLEALAIDTFEKVARERHKNLNTESSVNSASKALHANYSVIGSSIPLNKIHNWTVQLSHNYNRSLKGANMMLSVTMPEHLHGMTTKPVISKGTKEGEFFIEGMNFHMPGWWELTLDVDGYGSRDLIIFNVIVGEDMTMNQHNHAHHH